MRVIALVSAVLGMAVGACTIVQYGPYGPPAPDVVASAPGVVVTDPTRSNVRRFSCRPQPWCRWGRIRGPSY